MVLIVISSVDNMGLVWFSWCVFSCVFSFMLLIVTSLFNIHIYVDILSFLTSIFILWKSYTKFRQCQWTTISFKLLIIEMKFCAVSTMINVFLWKNVCDAFANCHV